MLGSWISRMAWRRRESLQARASRCVQRMWGWVVERLKRAMTRTSRSWERNKSIRLWPTKRKWHVAYQGMCSARRIRLQNLQEEKFGLRLTVEMSSTQKDRVQLPASRSLPISILCSRNQTRTSAASSCGVWFFENSEEQ